MQRLTTLLLLAGITFNAQAQTVDDYQPDSDGDGCIGMSDLLSLLSMFGSCETQTFTCNPLSYQGYDYATVQIGEQCWFAENLRSELYLNGDAIPADLNDDEWYTTTSGAVTVYGEGPNCDDWFAPWTCDEAWSLNEYGRLYNWHAVNDARGLCPSGWHVPTDLEWTVLIDHLGGEDVAGGQMKAACGWFDGGNGTNSSGFSASPGGVRTVIGDYIGAEHFGQWWSSSPNGDEAWARWINYYDDDVDRGDLPPRKGVSVRCIQDSEE